MKINFKIKSKAFLGATLSAYRAISPKPMLSVLKNFLIKVDGHALTIVGTDSDSSVKVLCEIESFGDNGSFCMDAKRLTELVRAMPDCDIDMLVDTQTNEAIIRYGNGKYKLMTYDGVEYPMDVLPEQEDVQGRFSISANDFRAIIDKVGFATGTDDFRPMMQGVYWDVTPDGATCVATDTHILAKFRTTAVRADVTMGFLLHNRALPIVKAVMPKNEDVAVIVTNKSIFIQTASVNIRTSRVVARFPDYNRVIPKETMRTATLSCDAFLAAVERVGLCTESGTPLLRLNFDTSVLTIQAQDVNYAMQAEEKVAVEYDCEPFAIGMSAEKMAGILRAVPTEKVVMKMNDAGRPALFLPMEQEENGELTLLCMPMCIK